MPENFFEKIKKNILPEWKACFFGALIIGFIAHFYKITNWLPNWDSLVFRYDPQNMISLGRWFLPVVCAPSTFYDLPFLNGLISIVLHGLGAACVCEILKIKKKITAFLIGAVTVSFPTVTSVLMYNYVADGYAVAFLLSCIAALLLTRKRPKCVISAILIALSVGIYQAYITVTIMLVVLHLLDELIFKKEETLPLLKKVGSCLLVGLAGMLLYYGILKVLLVISGNTLAEYQGIDTAVSGFTLNILGSLYNIKETLLFWLFDFSSGVSLFTILNVVIFLVTAFYYIKEAITNKVFTSVPKILILLLLVFFLIIGGNVLAFINAEIDYHNLMLMGYFVFYLCFVLLYEKGESKIKCWMVLVLSVLLITNQLLIANVSYHKAQIAYEKSYGTLIRIANRIEQLPDSDDYSEILVVGALEDSEDYSVKLPPDMTGITDGYIIRADDESVGQSVLCSALNDYCNKEYTFLSGEAKKAFLQKEEVMAMEEWPSRSSIAVVDGVIVINLEKEGESK